MFKGYITNLGKYNEGELVGKWITFPLEEDAEDILDSIGIDGENYEEYFFTDWDSDYSKLIDGLGEYHDIYDLDELGEELSRVYDMGHLLAYIEATDYDLDYAIKHHEDDSTYYGFVTACDLVEEIIPIDSENWEIVRAYFCCESYIRDLNITDTMYGYIETY